MLSQFKKKLKIGDKKHAEEIDDASEKPVPAEKKAIPEDVLKKNIASKLKNYRPVRRDANFTGPH